MGSALNCRFYGSRFLRLKKQGRAQGQCHIAPAKAVLNAEVHM